MDAITNAISETLINQVFVGAILILTVAGAILHVRRELHKLVSVMPNLLTGIGVLGTFLGIFLGLLEFDINDIQASVPPLLDGMKTAFVTSICGMTASIAMRVIIATIPQKETKTGAKTSEEFMDLVEELTDYVAEIKSDSEEHHKELIAEFKEFAKKITESSTDAIVKALEKVVHEFNEQLNEQFGENFKKLNEAVGKLLEWQENYKEELQHMQDQFKRCLESIERVEIAMASIKENTEAIPPAMEKLPEIIRTTTDTLDAFATMKDQAISAFPTIEENFENLIGGLEGQTKAFEEALTAQQESYKKLEGSFEGLGDKAQEAMEEIQKNMQENVRQTIAELRENFSQFDKEMRNEVTNVIEEMGSNLASLSEKFVNDYEPLTIRLKELLIGMNPYEKD